MRYRRAVWREALLSLVAFIIVVAGLFHEITLGGRTAACAPHIPFTLPSGPVGFEAPGVAPYVDPYGPGWIHEANFPYVERAFRAGELPLWQPHEGTGIPYFAGLLPGLLFPTNLLKFVGEPPLGFDLAYLARLVLAGWFLYGFLRLHRLRAPAAFCGGVIYLASGYLVGGMDLANAAGEAMIPGLLFGMECLLRFRRRRDLLLASLMVALTLVSGNPEAAFLALALAGVYALARALSLPRSTWVKSALLYLAAHGLGGLLAAPQWLPFLEFVGNSAHVHHPFDHVVVLPWPTAIRWIVPGFFRRAYESPVMAWSGGVYGIVTVGWILALSSWGSGTQTFLRRFAAIALAVIAAWYYGLPGFHLLSHAPIVNRIQVHKYAAVFLCLLPAVLAATGLHFVFEASARRAARWLLSAAATIAAVVAGFVFAWDRGWLALPNAAWLGPEAPVVPAVEFLPVLGAAMLVIAATARWFPRLNRPAGVLLTILVLAEVVHHRPRGYPPRQDIYRPPPFLESLEGDRRTFRIFSPDHVLYPNTATIFGLNDIRYCEALKPARLARLIARGFDYRAAGNYFPTFSIPIVSRAPIHALELLGVRYFLCEDDVEPLGVPSLPGPGRADVTVDARGGDYVLSGEWTGRAGASGTIQVWRNRTETGAVAVTGTVAGGGRDRTVELRLEDLPRDTFASLGVNAGPGRTLEIEEISWGGRPLSARHLKAGAHLPSEIASLDPIRIAGANLIALPVLPAGADPVLVLRGRSATGSIPVALTTVETEFLARVECRAESPGSPGHRAFRIDLGSLRGTRAQLGVVVIGEGSLTGLTVRPGRFEHLATHGRFKVYENPGALPRAFGVHRVRIEAEEEAQLDAVLDPGFPVRECAVVPRAPRGITLPNSPPGEAPEVTWRRESPSGARIELDVKFAADGLLVLHDTLYPGWSATVDGRPAEVVRANYCFRAVPIAAGAHRVTFVFSPGSLWIGVWLAIVAVVAFGVLAWRGRGLFDPVSAAPPAGSPLTHDRVQA